jgi:predicted transcriptional regulator of viral defense system
VSYLEQLLTVAGEQRGYITTSDAESVGVPKVELRKMAARGVLVRRGHGLYRIDAFPVQRHDEFMEANLWAGGKGVTSHESALWLWELADVNPRRIYVTVPNRTRRSGPSYYDVRVQQLQPIDLDWHQGIRITSPARSIADCTHLGTSGYLIEQAIVSARSYRLIDDPAEASLRSLLAKVRMG